MNELVCSVFRCFCVLLSMPQSSLDRRRSMRRESGKCYTMLNSKDRPRESDLAMNSLREWSQTAGRASSLTNRSFLGDIEVVLVRLLWVHHSSSAKKLLVKLLNNRILIVVANFQIAKRPNRLSFCIIVDVIEDRTSICTI